MNIINTDNTTFSKINIKENLSLNNSIQTPDNIELKEIELAKEYSKLKNAKSKNDTLPKLTIGANTSYNKIINGYGDTNSFKDPNFGFNISALIPIGSRELTAINNQADLLSDIEFLEINELETTYKNNILKYEEEINVLLNQLNKQTNIVSLQEKRIDLEQSQFIKRTKLTDKFAYYNSISKRLTDSFNAFNTAIKTQTELNSTIITKQIQKELKLINYKNNQIIRPITLTKTQLSKHFEN